MTNRTTARTTVRRAAALAALAFVAAGCETTGGAETGADPAAKLAEADAFVADNATVEGVKTTDSGLQYAVLKSGAEDGPHAGAHDYVCVHYAGQLLDGTQFDSSYARGGPAAFRLDKVIPGWTEGLQMMQPGDDWMLYIHPSLGYGEEGFPGGVIGPNEVLLFRVEFFDVLEANRKSAAQAECADIGKAKAAEAEAAGEAGEDAAEE